MDENNNWTQTILLLAAAVINVATAAVLCWSGRHQHTHAVGAIQESLESALVELPSHRDEPVEVLLESAAGLEESIEPAPIPAPLPTGTASPAPLDFDVLQAGNPDIVGWVYCPDTPISFPIHQGCGREATGSGTPLIADAPSIPIMHMPNSIIHSYDPFNGVIIDSFLGYKEQAYYDAHPFLWLLTPEADYRVFLMGACQSKPPESFLSPQTFQEAEDEMLRLMVNSTFMADAHLEGRLVTFLIQTGSGSDDCFAIYGLADPVDSPNG